MKNTFIGNNCSGTAIYKYLNIIYDNPFTWSIISPQNYVKLIQNFYTINFLNIKIIQLKDSKTYKLCKDNSMIFAKNTICILVDNLIEVYFPHHTLSRKTINKLKNRFYKFDKKQKIPFFIIDGFSNIYSKSDIELVLNYLKTYNKIGLCVSKYNIKNSLHIQINDSTNKNGIEVAKRYIIPILELQKLIP